MNKYFQLNKSKLTPPSYVFGIVWPILYGTLIYSLFNILGMNSKSCLIIFVIQMVLNLIWTYLFFGRALYWTSVLDIIGMIVLTYALIKNCGQNILIPYIIWISFALYLSLYIAIKN